jgi:hypothetical protein
MPLLIETSLVDAKSVDPIVAGRFGVQKLA